MTDYTALLSAMNAAKTVREKMQFSEYMASLVPKDAPSKKEKDMLTTLIEHELALLLSSFDKSAPYRIKNDMIGYTNSLLSLALSLYKIPAALPQSLSVSIAQILPIIQAERVLETEIEALFDKADATPSDIVRLSELLATITDEFQRGLFWSGLLHYEKQLAELPDESVSAFRVLAIDELTRLLALPADEDTTSSLEFACDLMKVFSGDDTERLLTEALTHADNAVVFYAASSLLALGASLPEETVIRLANDLEFAALLHEKLVGTPSHAHFPKDLTTPEYLAESDLVHWLVYPTELGQKPDEIRYLGSVMIKKIPYFLFIFRSDSDTLDDAMKNEWLIGWSAEDGNTFSNFDLYAEYAEKSLEKTIKRIKKELLY